jgi:hypothetical protein
MMQRVAAVLATMVLCSGCEPTRTAAPGVDHGKKKPETVVAKPPEFAPLPGSPEAEAEAAAAARAAQKPEVEMIREYARAGVSGRDKYDASIVFTPMHANFSLKEQAIFDLQIPKAMELFQGVHNRKPNSHAEFMREIIQKSNIRLPRLSEGARYIYDPEIGEFLIERPKPAN